MLNPILSQLHRMFGDWAGVYPTHDVFNAVMTICDHVNANYTQNERGRSSSTSAIRRADESEIVSMAKTIESIIRLERICMV